MTKSIEQLTAEYVQQGMPEATAKSRATEEYSRAYKAASAKDTKAASGKVDYSAPHTNAYAPPPKVQTPTPDKPTAPPPKVQTPTAPTPDKPTAPPPAEKPLAGNHSLEGVKALRDSIAQQYKVKMSNYSDTTLNNASAAQLDKYFDFLTSWKDQRDKQIADTEAVSTAHTRQAQTSAKEVLLQAQQRYQANPSTANLRAQQAAERAVNKEFDKAQKKKAMWDAYDEAKAAEAEGRAVPKGYSHIYDQQQLDKTTANINSSIGVMDNAMNDRTKKLAAKLGAKDAKGNNRWWFRDINSNYYKNPDNGQELIYNGTDWVEPTDADDIKEYKKGRFVPESSQRMQAKKSQTSNVKGHETVAASKATSAKALEALEKKLLPEIPAADTKPAAETKPQVAADTKPAATDESVTPGGVQSTSAIELEYANRTLQELDQLKTRQQKLEYLSMSTPLNTLKGWSDAKINGILKQYKDGADAIIAKYSK
jgi:hypothetical protein